MNNLVAEIGRKLFVLFRAPPCSQPPVFVLNESSLTTRENLIFASIYDRGPVAKRQRTAKITLRYQSYQSCGCRFNFFSSAVRHEVEQQK